MSFFQKLRLAAGPGQVIDRSKPIQFTFDGKSVPAYQGDTLGSALASCGQDVLSRSFKYHRPRGLYCLTGSCPNCMVEVDGVPSVRACQTACLDRMVVKSQNRWPSLKFDFLRIGDFFSFLMPVGFYYKTFIHPRFAWPLAEKFLKRAAGLGLVKPPAADPHAAVPSEADRPHGHYEVMNRQVDVAVVGGGPAGMAAALAAISTGQKVILLEREPSLGGHLRYQAGSVTEPVLGTVMPAHQVAQTTASRVLSSGIEAVTGAEAFGIWEGNLLSAVQGGRLWKIRAGRIVLATGRAPHQLVFANNDLPGIYLGDAVKRLINLYGVLPGKRAVVVTSNPASSLAEELRRAGAAVAEVVDYPRCVPLEALGFSRLRGVVLADMGPDGKPMQNSRRTVECDLLVLEAGYEPVAGLLGQGGCSWQGRAGSASLWPCRLTPGIQAAGHVTGIEDLEVVIEQGRLAGEGFLPEAVEPLRADAAQMTAYRVLPGSDPKKFVCLCEDVTEKDLKHAIAEGFDEPELLKRYSTVSMGPCQGKTCSMTAGGFCGTFGNAAIVKSPVTLTTMRPPSTPVSLGVLGAGKHHPVRYTPLHRQHEAAGAVWMDMGEWKRPLHYGDVDAECRAVHEAAGIIDVGTLGKLVVQGKDAGALLDFAYTHKFSDLKPGRVRYGLMCDDTGTILDDGTITRTGDESFFITTTSGNVSFVEQWLKWWGGTKFSCVHVHNVTAGYASVNLAGPKARAILSGLTRLDLSNEAFPYMACQEAEVAGVPCRLMRIGFVGETGWEIHFPAEAGEHLWTRLMEAGKPLGLKPFGIAAQRVLRLQKGHVIIGVDTDGLTNPWEIDMRWAVKLDKPDFVGKNRLTALANTTQRQRLVAFSLAGKNAPGDGAAVVQEGFPVGRVTSARYSAFLGKTIGLALVNKDGRAELGDDLEIRWEGQKVFASVAKKPFYDPEGARLKQ